MNCKQDIIDLAQEFLIVDEGFSPNAYHDHLGFPTIGFGQKLSNDLWGDLKEYPRVNKENALEFLTSRLWSSYERLELYGWVKEAEPLRTAIILCMEYQLGLRGLEKFVRTKEAWLHNDFGLTSERMLNSKWATQTENRANRYAQMMKTNRISEYYK